MTWLNISFSNETFLLWHKLYYGILFDKFALYTVHNIRCGGKLSIRINDCGGSIMLWGFFYLSGTAKPVRVDGKMIAKQGSPEENILYAGHF